jgi:2'-hydroxyisoflavone reductase
LAAVATVMHALVIGGTRFIGRHLVDQLRDDGHDVTVFTRGESGNPFADADDVAHVQGDRTDEAAVAALADDVAPDWVFDMVAYHPSEVEHATDVFADVDAYVYTSSISAYDDSGVPLRDGEAALHDCTAEQATDDSPESYGPRKAEGDRVVARAAEDGVNAMAVRPGLVWGPHDYTERFDYWLARIAAGDPFLVPGDGGSLLHFAYVEDVASGLYTVAREGDPGEAYDAVDRVAYALGDVFDQAAAAMDADPEPVYASARELAREDVEPTDFPLYTDRPFVASSAKLDALGWDHTPRETAMERCVADFRESERDGSDHGPDRDAEAELLDARDD